MNDLRRNLDFFVLAGFRLAKPVTLTVELKLISRFMLVIPTPLSDKNFIRMQPHPLLLDLVKINHLSCWNFKTQYFLFLPGVEPVFVFKFDPLTVEILYRTWTRTNIQFPPSSTSWPGAWSKTQAGQRILLRFRLDARTTFYILR